MEVSDQHHALATLPWGSTLVCIDYEPELSLKLVWKIWRCILKYLDLMKMWKSEMTM